MAILRDLIPEPVEVSVWGLGKVRVEAVGEPWVD